MNERVKYGASTSYFQQKPRMKFGSGFPENLTTIIEPNLPNKISLNKNIANLSPK